MKQMYIHMYVLTASQGERNLKSVDSLLLLFEARDREVEAVLTEEGWQGINEDCQQQCCACNHFTHMHTRFVRSACHSYSIQYQ